MYVTVHVCVPTCVPVLWELAFLKRKPVTQCSSNGYPVEADALGSKPDCVGASNHEHIPCF